MTPEEYSAQEARTALYVYWITEKDRHATEARRELLQEAMANEESKSQAKAQKQPTMKDKLAQL